MTAGAFQALLDAAHRLARWQLTTNERRSAMHTAYNRKRKGHR